MLINGVIMRKKNTATKLYLPPPKTKGFGKSDAALMAKIYTSLKNMTEIGLYEEGQADFSEKELLLKLSYLYKDNLEAYRELGKLRAVRAKNLKKAARRA